MVVRKKKYQSGEASNFVTRKQALHKLQLNLKVRKYVILRMPDNICKKTRIYGMIIVNFLGFSKIMYFERNTSQRTTQQKTGPKRRPAYYQNTLP